MLSEEATLSIDAQWRGDPFPLMLSGEVTLSIGGQCSASLHYMSVEKDLFTLMVRKEINLPLPTSQGTPTTSPGTLGFHGILVEED